MKTIITSIAFFMSLSAFANSDIPVTMDSEAMNALLYGANIESIADLKEGSNSILVQKQDVRARDPKTTKTVKFTFTTKMCVGIARCIGSKQMTVTRKTIIRPGKSVTQYESTPVVRIR